LAKSFSFYYFSIKQTLPVRNRKTTLSKQLSESNFGRKSSSHITLSRAIQFFEQFKHIKSQRLNLDFHNHNNHHHITKAIIKMQLTNLFLAVSLPLLALAQDTTVATTTSTQTITRTVHVSQVSTITLTSSSSAAPNTTSTYIAPVTAIAQNSTTPLGTGTGGVVPTSTGSGTEPTSSVGAGAIVSASNAGLLGFIAVAVAALL
jgi:hypothetical protein